MSTFPKAMTARLMFSCSWRPIGFISYCCGNKLQTQWLKTCVACSFIVLEAKSLNVGLMRRILRCWQGWVPSGGSRGEPFPYFSSFRILPALWLHWATWIIQDNLPVLIFLILITSAESLLPWKVTESQISGMKTWTSLNIS